MANGLEIKIPQVSYTAPREAVTTQYGQEIPLRITTGSMDRLLPGCAICPARRRCVVERNDEGAPAAKILSVPDLRGRYTEALASGEIDSLTRIKPFCMDDSLAETSMQLTQGIMVPQRNYKSGPHKITVIDPQ